MLSSNAISCLQVETSIFSPFNYTTQLFSKLSEAKEKKKTKKIPDTLEDVSNSFTGPMSPAFDYFNQEIFISSSCTSLLHIQVLRPDRKKH